MKKKLIIWDWNGTLIEDVQLTYGIAAAMQAERALPKFRDLEHYRATVCFPIIEYYRRMGYTFQDESFEDVAADFVARYEAAWRLLGLRVGATSALQLARKAGLRQSVLSASRYTRLKPQVEFFGVARYVGEILGAQDDLAHGKAYLAAQYMSENRLKPQEVIFIGDTDHDFAVANSVGCDCILLDGGHQSRDILEKCGVPVCENPFDAVKSLL